MTYGKGVKSSCFLSLYRMDEMLNRSYPAAVVYRIETKVYNAICRDAILRLFSLSHPIIWALRYSAKGGAVQAKKPIAYSEMAP